MFCGAWGHYILRSFPIFLSKLLSKHWQKVSLYMDDTFDRKLERWGHSGLKYIINRTTSFWGRTSLLCCCGAGLICQRLVCCIACPSLYIAAGLAVVRLAGVELGQVIIATCTHMLGCRKVLSFGCQLTMYNECVSRRRHLFAWPCTFSLCSV